jgi:hypothetical protein
LFSVLLVYWADWNVESIYLKRNRGRVSRLGLVGLAGEVLEAHQLAYWESVKSCVSESISP